MLYKIHSMSSVYMTNICGKVLSHIDLVKIQHGTKNHLILGLVVMP